VRWNTSDKSGGLVALETSNCANLELMLQVLIRPCVTGTPLEKTNDTRRKAAPLLTRIARDQLRASLFHVLIIEF
jgi:hypothetical protein